MAGAFYYRGFKAECDTQNVLRTIGIRDADFKALHPFTGGPGVNQIRHDGQTQLEYAFVAPFIAHLIREEPQDLLPWRKWALIPIGEPWPELITQFTTPLTTHGLKGYQLVYRLELTYSAIAQVSLAVSSFDGTSPQAMTLPSTADVKTKILLTPTFNKGRLFSYSLTGAGFRLFDGECSVWIGEWGREGPCAAWQGLNGDFGQGR